MNSETWSSRLVFGREANNPIPEKKLNVMKPEAMPAGGCKRSRWRVIVKVLKASSGLWYHRERRSMNVNKQGSGSMWLQFI
jgi:hypothetical protein